MTEEASVRLRNWTRGLPAFDSHFRPLTSGTLRGGLTILCGATDGKVLFYGSGDSDVDHFMFYFESVAEVDSEGELQAMVFIKYLWGEAFHSYYLRFTVPGELTAEAINYDCVKRAFCEKFGKQRERGNQLKQPCPWR